MTRWWVDRRRRWNRGWLRRFRVFRHRHAAILAFLALALIPVQSHLAFHGRQTVYL